MKNKVFWRDAFPELHYFGDFGPGKTTPTIPIFYVNLAPHKSHWSLLKSDSNISITALELLRSASTILKSSTLLSLFKKYLFIWLHKASLVTQLVKNLPAMQETWVRSLGWEDPLAKGKATHSKCSGPGEFHGLYGVAKNQTWLSDLQKKPQFLVVVHGIFNLNWGMRNLSVAAFKLLVAAWGI